MDSLERNGAYDVVKLDKWVREGLVDSDVLLDPVGKGLLNFLKQWPLEKSYNLSLSATYMWTEGVSSMQ